MAQVARPGCVGGPVEVDDDLVVRSRFIADSREGVLRQGAEFLRAKEAGLIGDDDSAADEHPEVAARRELEEETGYRPDSIELSNQLLARRSGLPRPTVSRLTYTLTLLGYLSRDTALQKYRLGPGVLSLGHPLLGDPVYGRSKIAHRDLLNQLDFKRQALHAETLGFVHPVSKENLTFKSAIPSDMQELFRALTV